MKSLLCAILLFGATLSISSCNRDSSIAPHIYIDTVTIWDTLIHLDTIYLDTIDLDTIVIIDDGGDTSLVDGFEPDDNFLEATVLTMDSVQSHLISNSDEDWCSFNAEAGVVYEISLAKNIGYFYSLKLYHANMVEIETETINSLSKGGSLLWKATSSGSYPFSISLASNSVSDTVVDKYSVRVRKYPIDHVDLLEPNDFPTDAKQITIDDLASELSLTVYDTDWVYFEVLSGNAYDIASNWDYDGEDYVRYFHLFNGSANGSILMAGMEHNRDEEFHYTYFAEKDTTIYLKAFHGSIVTAPYSLSVGLGDLGETDIFEPNNSNDSATAININTPYDLTLHVFDVDWLTFTADSGVTYKIALTDIENTYIDLLFTKTDEEGDGQIVASSYSKDDSIYYKADSTESLYLRFSASYQSKYKLNKYKVQVSAVPNADDDTYEPNDTISTATPLVSGALAQEHTLSIGDTDWFTITGIAGKNYTLSIATDGIDSGTVILYKKAYNSVSIISSTEIVENSAQISWDVDSTQLYYIRFTGETEEAGSYTITAVEQ